MIVVSTRFTTLDVFEGLHHGGARNLSLYIQAYKLYTNSVLKYPRLGQVALAFREIKARLKTVTDYIDNLEYPADDVELMRKSF